MKYIFIIFLILFSSSSFSMEDKIFPIDESKFPQKWIVLRSELTSILLNQLYKDMYGETLDKGFKIKPYHNFLKTYVHWEGFSLYPDSIRSLAARCSEGRDTDLVISGEEDLRRDVFTNILQQLNIIPDQAKIKKGLFLSTLTQSIIDFEKKEERTSLVFSMHPYLEELKKDIFDKLGYSVRIVNLRSHLTLEFLSENPEDCCSIY